MDAAFKPELPASMKAQWRETSDDIVITTRRADDDAASGGGGGGGRRRTAGAQMLLGRGGQLPVAVAKVLPPSARSDPSTAKLWKAVRACYPSEEAALAALKRNPALCLPWACSVPAIRGSYAYILEGCGEEAALDVITKNPGALGNDPTRLRRSGAQEIIGAANLAAALGSLQGLIAPAAALVLIAAALGPDQAIVELDIGALARPLAGTVGATAFLSTAAVAVYVASRRGE